MFGNNKMNRENVSMLDRYLREGYKETYPQEICWRKATSKEIAALPDKYTTRSKVNGPVIALAVEIFFTAWAVIYSIMNIVKHEENAWFSLYLFSILGLFAMIFTIYAIFDRKDRKITTDSLVTVGEVVEMRPARRNPKTGDVIEADHIIALHGSRRIVTIRESHVTDPGTTVIVQKSKGMKYHLAEIPYSAADYDVNEEDHRTELESYDDSKRYDYSMYTHTNVNFANSRRALNDMELKSIPSQYRSPNPFKRGWITWVWLGFTALTAVFVLYLRKLCITHDDMFIPMIAGFLCELFIWLFISSAALKTPMSKKNAVGVDCIIINKTFNGSNGTVTAIIPEHQQFIDDIFASTYVFKNVPLNEPVRLYFGLPKTEAVYFRKV